LKEISLFMKRSLMLAALIAMGLPAAVWAAKPADLERRPVFPFPIRKTVLDNGLAVVSVPFDSPGIIAYYTVVRTGSRNEVEKGLSGFAHFFEHMMFRGTEKYPQEKYNDVLKSLGADSNGFTNQDWTCYHMTIPASALATAVEIEADRFQNLKYDEPSFQKEARAVLGEYNKSSSSPFLKLSEALLNTAFTKHTYKHTTIGFLEDIKDMPNQYTYSKVFFDRWYRPENCSIVVTGDVKHEELVSLVRSHYGAWPRGKGPVAIPEEPAQAGPRSAHLGWPVPTLPTLCLGYHVPASDPSNPDVAALGALEQAVFGETSPLYKELVLKEQKVVTLMADASPRRDPGLLTVYVRYRKPEDFPAVRKRIAQALEEAARTPVEPARLDDVRSHLRYAYAASLRSPDAVALTVCDSIAIDGRPDAMNDLFATYDRLTPADLQRVAARYFTPTNETMITLETERKK
jgi:zinc protease